MPHTEVMRWVLSIFRARKEPPRPREIPLLLLKAAIWGFATGPFVSLFFTALWSPSNVAGYVTSPVSLLVAALVGSIFGLSFYTCCGLGNLYLAPWVIGYPPGIARTIFAVFNIVASSLAFTLAVAILELAWGGEVTVQFPYFWRILAVDGLIAAVRAFVIGAFFKLLRQVEQTQSLLREKEVETARAQARALQSQINPHFFFNTLNTISALIDDDSAAAKRTLGQLADMFRYTLGCTNTEAVALDREIQFVRDYLAIEQARFRQRLTIELPDGLFPDSRVPGLVLQPLVENAVKYGIAPRIEGGTVSVRITRQGGGARVSVRNTPGDEDSPLRPASLFRDGHALENVRARLRLFTGQAEPLHVSRTPNWTEFSFEMPR